ncbi:phosphopyruvate hydratase [Candidatus Microgenomates bacterium]|nr:MAG: phosphopyruvate hydratase [Candidatus Microgenomates bacterium]
MSKIKLIKAEEILDSRGNPTIETTVVLNDNTTASAACPSGASTGTYEAVELRDKDEKRFRGQGVLKAVDNVQNIIAPKLIGMDPTKQSEIDRAMIDLDGTQNKEKLGANAMLSVSMAVSKAGAKSSMLPLFLYLRQFIRKENLQLKIPTPLFNLINAGKHSDCGLDIQEFIVIPASSRSYSEALSIGASIYKFLKDSLKTNNLSTLVGDEGGFAPKLNNNMEALALLKDAVSLSQHKLGFDVFLGLDAASNSFYKGGQYNIKDKPTSLSSNELITYYDDIRKKFGLLYLEDGLSEDDWEGWTKLSSEFSQNTIVTGDDLTVTNLYRLQMAINKKAISGIIIKPNQIGTVIEALAVVEVARQAGLKIIVSHRSGETNDDFIADFAVAVSADYVKFGAPARGERVAKYNRLLHIEQQFKEIQNK